MDILQNLKKIKVSVPTHVTVVAVSKTKPIEMISDLFKAGHLDFGENKVQDLLHKAELLSPEIRWHMIGHLQSNKVKYIAPFVHLIHGVDSLKLLSVIDKEGAKNKRIIPCLFQMHIAEEESKFGFSEDEIIDMLDSDIYRDFKFVRIKGMMGMATFTDDSVQVKREFKNLKRIFEKVKTDHFSLDPEFSILSMGMSGDYILAIEEGSTMVRVGSSIFGPR
jgi:hypothetical protein